MALFLGEKSKRKLDENGEGIGKKQYKEAEPEIMKDEGERQTEEPIAGADQLFFGEEI